MQKEKEVLILRKALNFLPKQEQTSIILSEAPDFILTNNINSFRLGIEVTELYLSDTHARISNKTDYFRQLVNGNSHHREDVILLFKEPLFTSCSLDQDKCIQGIIEFYSKEIFIERILELIRKKENKVSNYLKQCQECILIINFNQNVTFYFEKQSDLKDAILEDIESSCFKEIILFGETSSLDIAYLLKEDRSYSFQKVKSKKEGVLID